MLASLAVRDLVLIEKLDLELSPGFNVLTGETGAGKSLVAVAVGLLLGRPAGGELVRRGADLAEVEGLFDVADEPAVRERLAAAGLPADDELLIRRVVPAAGRQRCFVNGRLSSRAVLAGLAEGLASMAGQHEHHALLDAGRQLELLDAHAGLADDVAEMSRLATEAERAARRLESLLARERGRAQRLDFLRYQLAEIDDLAPEPGELERLDRETEILRHGERLLETARTAEMGLYEADGSVFERLGAIRRSLERAAEHDPALAEDEARLAEASEAVEETARRLAAYADGLDADPARLSELEERRAALRELVRKHGADLDEILARRQALAEEADELARFDEAVEKAREGRDAAAADARRHADALTRKRRRAAKRLAAAVRAELADLAFGQAGFEAVVEPTGATPGPTGADRVDLVVALNPGEGAHPLARVASGGELSRLMLAVRRALAGVGPVGTYVFDEVDAGIGGAVASAVGRKLRDVARHHQVVCITHLPQIAGLADAHFVVEKSGRGGRTVADVRRLTEPQRVQEIARMLAGAEPTEKAEAAARELMRS